MSEFRPMFSGFAPSFVPTEPPARIIEVTPMSIISENADRIVNAITDNGGSMTGEQLREELSDMEAVDRRNAISRLRAENRITSTGATTRITYSLPGHKGQANGAGREASAHARVVSVSTATRPMADRSGVRTDTPSADADADADGIDQNRRWAICMQVPLVNGTPEVQLLGALDFIAEHFGTQGLDASAIGRAATWLASKHQVAA